MNMEMEGKMGTSMPSKDITSKSELSNNIAQDQSTMKMGDNSRIEMDSTWSFNFTYYLLMFLMWWFMMIAMMVPSAFPTLLLFHSLKNMGSEPRYALPHTYLFLFWLLLRMGIF